MTARFPDLPKAMAKLPVDHRGFPVPWFVAYVDGEPSFPVADGAKFMLAHKASRCWVCGGHLDKWRASVIGPMCAINRTISEPQSHLECARFSARNCPFLSRPAMKRVPEGLLPVNRIDAAGDGIKRNPGAVALWIETRPTRRYRVHNGYLFELGEPKAVEWYAHGREATRDEVEESIYTGLPLLVEACQAEPTAERRDAAMAELERRAKGVEQYLPLGLAA